MRIKLSFIVPVALALAGLSALAANFPPHPFVLVDGKELDQLRAELAAPGWKADLYAARHRLDIFPSGTGIRSNADFWLKRTIVIPARGGYGHDFYCEEGDRLEFPKQQEFVPGPYRCPKCGRVYSGEKYEGAMRFYVHLWLAVGARDLALTAALEHNPEYAAKAAEILLKYAAAYPGPHTKVTVGGILYQSLDESLWVIPLSEAYDLIYDDLSPAQRVDIERFLKTVAGGLMQCGLRGNWGSWHLSAVGVVGYATGDQALVEWATQEFKNQIRDQLGDDGLWPESVHTYHFFALAAFCHFAEASWHAGVDLYHWQGKPGKSLLSMFTAALPYAYPDGRLPAINDGWFDSFLPLDFYELAWHRTGDPLFGAVLAQSQAARGGAYAFLFGGALPASAVPFQSSSTNYSGLGLCTLRSSNSMVTFHYGPFLGHGHPDKMSITLFAGDRLWAADYGTPGYGSAILPWYKSTFSHNTIVVDGVSEDRTTEDAADAWLGDPLLESVRSTTKQAYPGVTFTRTVARVGRYFVMRDQLQSDREHDYDFYLHGEGQLSLSGAEEAFQPAKPATRWIKKLFAAKAGQSISARWSAGGECLAVSVAGDQPMTILKGECPAESGGRLIPLLIARQRGKSAEFVSVLFPCREADGIDSHWDGTTLTVQHDGVTDSLAFAPDNGRPALQRRAGSAVK